MTGLPQLYDLPWGRMLLYPNDLVGGLTMGPGENFWDGPLLLPFFDKYADVDKTAIDVGASYGQNLLYLSPRSKTVYGFEPILHREMVENVKLNGCQNVICMAAACYSKPCLMSLAPEEMQGQAVAGLGLGEIRNIGGISLVQDNVRGTILGVQLDLMIPASARPVGLIKTDAQGCDLQALRGAEQIIREDRPAILFEFEEGLAKMHGDSWRDYLMFFRAFSYDVAEQDKIGYPRNFVAVPR